MFCPSCRAEFRPGFTECTECEVYLVDALPPDPYQETVDLVPVFRTSDPIVLPLVRSLLDSAGVPYLVQGEEALGLFPLGPAGGRVARSAVGAVVHVAKGDADSVKEMLSDLEQD